MVHEWMNYVSMMKICVPLTINHKNSSKTAKIISIVFNMFDGKVKSLHSSQCNYIPRLG